MTTDRTFMNRHLLPNLKSFSICLAFWVTILWASLTNFDTSGLAPLFANLKTFNLLLFRLYFMFLNQTHGFDILNYTQILTCFIWNRIKCIESELLGSMFYTLLIIQGNIYKFGHESLNCRQTFAVVEILLVDRLTKNTK